jgi:hypothetical protein
MKRYPHFRDLELLHGITWLDLADLEPRLGELLWVARQLCVACRCWADVDRVFAPIRNSLADLVGFTAKARLHPVLGCPGAYEVAYWRLYDAVAGLLPKRPGGVEATLKQQRGEPVAETCPLESAAPAIARV